MSSGNIKMAIAAIRSNRWRSLLTMLGIVIGIVSVVTTVSIGEGIKKQASNQINHLGNNIISIRPGRSVKRDSNGQIAGVNYFSSFGVNTLTDKDLDAVSKVPDVQDVVPLSLVQATAKNEEREFADGYIIGTSDQLPKILNQKIESGAFFTSHDETKNVAVIGRNVAVSLFHELTPIGRVMSIRGQDFIVRGVLQKSEATSLIPYADFNSAVFIPYSVSKNLDGNSPQIYEILVGTIRSESVEKVAVNIRSSLKTLHGGDEDFSVLKHDETIAVTNGILDMMTRFVASVAAISLLVGGIGVMNIMLVAVSERTREIGVRKAVGATNHQILKQFLVEATTLSLLGGFLGIALSLLVNFLLRILTPMEPVITLPIIVIATGVSVIVGIIFGIMPALTASRKDPIQALRYE